MPTSPPAIALLRGINVGGKNKLPMKTLTAIFEELGCSNVRSYIQSGNVVFEAGASLTKRIPALVSAAIAEQLELQVPVIVRTAAAFKAAHKNNPFAKRGEPPESLHIGFLQKKPSTAKIAALDPDRSPGDSFVVQGSEVYFHCPNGLARTKLTNAFFDKGLGTITTVRNHKTVMRLLSMISD